MQTSVRNVHATACEPAASASTAPATTSKYGFLFSIAGTEKRNPYSSTAGNPSLRKTAARKANRSIPFAAHVRLSGNGLIAEQPEVFQNATHNICLQQLLEDRVADGGIARANAALFD
jgi:hypothetical protein